MIQFSAEQILILKKKQETTLVLCRLIKVCKVYFNALCD